MKQTTTKELTQLNKYIVDKVFSSIDVSEATLRDYRYRIDLFMRHTQEHGMGHDTFVEFKRSLTAREDLSVSTKNKHLTATRVFLKELNRKGIVPVDITQNVRSFKQSRGHKVDGLNAKDVAALQETLSFLPTSRRQLRLYSLFYLLAYQGLRQIEVVRINRENLDLENGTVFIRGKGRSDLEKIFLAPETVEALRGYLEVVGFKSGALFRSFSDRPSSRLTTRSINRELKALFKLANVDKTVHGIRHFYITHLLNSGFDMRDVCKFSRHKSIDMLLVYDDELDIKKKAQAVFACLPKLSPNSMSTNPNYTTYKAVGGFGAETPENATSEARTCAISEALEAGVTV